MLEKVLGVSAVRSWPYLVAKCSLVGVDVDGTSYPLCRPIMGGRWPSAQSLWFGKILACLVTKPFFGRVTALMDPHATTIRLGPRAPGPTLSGLITLCGEVPSSYKSYPRVCKLLRRLALL
jgi:hypothetical protein